ncbi:MAG: IS66 family transposase [Armatimonadota bacterium]|nr:IS66 family transposase [Armatimonadota bacterium]
MPGLWQGPSRRLSARSGTSAHLRAAHRGAGGLAAPRATHLLRAPATVDGAGLWPGHQPGRDRRRSLPASLKSSPCELHNIVRRLAENLQPRPERIRRSIRASPVIGCDETGARVDGTNRWQWVFETPQASYHLIADSRGSRVIDDVLGDVKPQVWVSDCFSVQMKAPAQRRQLCMAHQLRDLQYGIEAERCSFCWRMQQLFGRAMRLDARCDEVLDDLFAAQVRHIEAACDSLLVDDASGKHGRRLQKRYRKHRDSLFTFLQREDVPADNNASERALRTPVVHRKVSGGFRSRWGAEAYATVSTVLQTARKHGHDPLETLTDALGPSIDDNLLLQPP